MEDEGDSTGEADRVGHDRLLERLKRLTEEAFERVVRRLEVDPAALSSAQAPRATRALELMRAVEALDPGAGAARVDHALAGAAAASAEDAARLLAEHRARSARGVWLNNVFLEHAVPLEDLFVELSIARVDEAYERGVRYLVKELHLLADLTRERFELRTARRVPLDAFLDPAYPVQVILGDPGSGKTTLLRAIHQAIAAGRHPQYSIPLFVSLRRYAATDARRGRSLLEHAISQELRCDPSDLAAALRGAHAAGRRVLLLLDGLDEVSTDGALVDRLCAELERCPYPCVLSSRRAGYPRAVAPHRTCEVMELSEPTARRLVVNWFRAVGRGEPEAQRFLGWVNDRPAMGAMSRNPCLLTLLCYLDPCENEALRAPLTRFELYHLAVLKLREDCQQRAGVELTRRDLAVMSAFCEHLLLLPGPRQLFGGEQFAAFAEGAGHDAPDLSLRWARSKLVARWNDEDTYHFTHLSFQEWFAALAATRSPGHLRDLCADSQRVLSPYWREVWTFVAGWCAAAPTATGDGCFRDLLGAALRRRDRFGLVLLAVAPWVGQFGAERAEALLGEPLRERLLDLARSLPLSRPFPDDQADPTAFTRKVGRGLARALIAMDSRGALRWALAALGAPAVAERQDGLDRFFALMILSELRDAEALAALEALARGDSRWRTTAFIYLGLCAPRAAAALLGEVFARRLDDGFYLAVTAAPDGAIADVVAGALDVAPPDARWEFGVRALAWCRDARAAGYVRKFRGAPWRDGVFADVVASLGALATDDAAATLRELVGAERDPARIARVIHALERWPTRVPWRAFEPFAHHAAWAVRRRALRAIARHADAEAAAWLSARLLAAGASRATRLACLHAITRHGVTACEPAVARLAEDAASSVRDAAAHARLRLELHGRRDASRWSADLASAVARVATAWPGWSQGRREAVLRGALTAGRDFIRALLRALPAPDGAPERTVALLAALAARGDDATHSRELFAAMAHVGGAVRMAVARDLVAVDPGLAVETGDPALIHALQLRSLFEGYLYYEDHYLDRSGTFMRYGQSKEVPVRVTRSG